MDAKLKTENIDYLEKKADMVFTHEETAEVIVPDTMPDIMEIVDTDGIVTVRSKEAENGRIIITGIVSAFVLFRAEEEERLFRLEASIPFTSSQDAAQITPESQLCVTIDIGGLDARIINSRKALVRADLIANAVGYENNQFTWSNAMDDDMGADVEVLEGSTKADFVTQVKEKSFVLTDEFALPAGKAPISQILKNGINIVTEDIKLVGSKLIFKGETRIKVLYIGEGETEPETMSFSAPFSQILEMDREIEDAQYDVFLLLTNCYIDSASTVSADNMAVAVEIHIAAQAVCTETFELMFISDVYSPKFNLEEEREEIVANSENAKYDIQAEGRETVELNEPVHKVLDCNVTVGKAFSSIENGELLLKATVCATAVYLTDRNRVCSVSRKFEIKAKAEYSESMTYSIKARVMGDSQASSIGNGIEFWVPIQFTVRQSRQRVCKCVCGISWDDEEERDLTQEPSLIIHHCLRGETIWQMAKKYRSSKELIREMNEMEEGTEPEPGKLFIIPRKR